MKAAFARQILSRSSFAFLVGAGRAAVVSHLSHTASLRVFNDPGITEVQTPGAGSV
jgi:hypothetical protein